MKIVVTGTRGIPGIMGGIETHCEQLFPRVAAKGFDVTVVRRKGYASDNLKEWNGVMLKDIPAPKAKAFEALIHTFRAIDFAAKNKADVIHINAIGPALAIPYAKLRGLKVVFTHHGPDYDRKKWGWAARLALKIGERLGVKYSDQIIVISDTIRSNIQGKFGRTGNVNLIFNGVPDPVFCNFTEYFDSLGICPGKYVLCVSRFVPEKRLEDIIKAFSKSGLKDIGYKLVIAGDTDFEDNYSSSLKRMAGDEGVVLTGFIKGKELQSLFSHASVFALTSSHEGLPISLLEAMSYKLPVVVSDIPANMELGLSPDCYFKLGDIDSLSKGVGSKAGTGPIYYDMTRYNWDCIAEKTIEVYKKL